MTTTVRAYGVYDTNGPVEPVTLERRDVGAHAASASRRR